MLKYFMQTKISFQLNSPTSVAIMRGDKQIGQIWSESSSGTTPYPHDNSIYCLNSIQICGFDKMSEVWACGPFSGHKDCVVHFLPTDENYYQEKKGQYSRYVRDFKGDVSELLNFKDFCSVHPF
jgi:hypothetical protein